MPNTESEYHNSDSESGRIGLDNPRISPPARRHSPPYIVDQIVEAGRIHLASGPSWVGVTRWLLQLLNLVAWAEEDYTAFLGRQVHYTPHAYVSYEATQREVEASARSVGVHKSVDKLVSLIGRAPHLTALDSEQRVKDLINVCEGAALIAVEPFDALIMGKKFDRESVFQSLCRIKQITERANVTLIGTIPTVKERNGQEYNWSFDRFIGSATWNTMCHSHFVLDFAKFELWSKGEGVRHEAYEFGWSDEHRCFWPGKLLPEAGGRREAHRPRGDNDRKILSTIHSRLSGRIFKPSEVAKLARVGTKAVRRCIERYGEMFQDNEDGTYHLSEPRYKN